MYRYRQSFQEIHIHKYLIPTVHIADPKEQILPKRCIVVDCFQIVKIMLEHIYLIAHLQA